MTINKRSIGAQYEELAAAYLEHQGYKILARNYRNKFGELDIIAKKDGVLVYVEVKYRGNQSCGDPLEAVDRRKQMQICRVAACHYAKYGATAYQPCRFDVIGVYRDETIRHIENAFEFYY
ncbi:MAG: YraN family protein [Clostridium sp.]|nr:YraN family protein [Clostridium sp.]MCM1400174.1 YraN family protein [Clostridium sp.]